MERKKAEFEKAKALLDEVFEIAEKEGFGFGAGVLSEEVERISTFAVNMNIERWGHILVENLPSSEHKEHLGHYLLLVEKEG